MTLTPEQRAIRVTGIGGSEIAGIAGLSRWMRPIDVFQRKLGIAPEFDGHHLERGTYLEPGLVAWACKRTGRAYQPCSTTLRHPKYPRVVATPDAMAPGRTLEVKAPGWRNQDAWGASGTDEVPEYYVPQLMFEAACAGVQIADAAAEINGDLRIYSVPFDEELFESLAEMAEKFWRDHVETQIPPPVDFSESYTDYLTRRFPQSRGLIRQAGAQGEMIAEELRAARAVRIAAEKREAEIANAARALIGEADGFEGPWGKITWRKSKDRHVIDHRAIVAELGASNELIAKHTTITPGSRRLVVPRSWGRAEDET